MPCYQPIHGFRAPGGTVKFSRSGAYPGSPITVSCGQCSGCRLERSRQWAVRCMHEAQMHATNCFITLTYDDEHLPPDSTLDVEHWKLFAKRTRKRCGKFRFYHCGEYGDENARPHYHAAIFGLDFLKDRVLEKHTQQGHALYTSELLTELWGQGKAWIGELTFESAAYVARYIMKKQTGQQAESHYFVRTDEQTGEVVSRKPEYTTMSRRPGIGATWIHKYMTDVYPSDQVVTNGKAAQPPKFYDSAYKKQNPEAFKALQMQRRIKAIKNEANQTYDRLAVRETVSKARMAHYTRNPS